MRVNSSRDTFPDNQYEPIDDAARRTRGDIGASWCLVEPLLIQLTLVTPVGSVIANSILELLNIDSWYCRRGGKHSEEVGMLSECPPQSCRLGCFVTFNIPYNSCFPLIGTPSNARSRFVHQYDGGAQQGACSNYEH
ncbi:hypothetical protein Tco_0528906 [Tanacetum coccineum]